MTFAEVEKSLLEKPENAVLTPNSVTSSSTSLNDFYSCVSDSEDERYFDLDEEAEGPESMPVILQSAAESDVIWQLFRSVDDLCGGDEKQQMEALAMLRAKEEEVSHYADLIDQLLNYSTTSRKSLGK